MFLWLSISLKLNLLSLVCFFGNLICFRGPPFSVRLVSSFNWQGHIRYSSCPAAWAWSTTMDAYVLTHRWAYLENVVALLTRRADDERRHGVGLDDQRFATTAIGAAETESFLRHLADQRPIFRARIATTIEPVAILERPLAIHSALLSENRPVIFVHHFPWLETLDSPE